MNFLPAFLVKEAFAHFAHCLCPSENEALLTSPPPPSTHFWLAEQDVCNFWYFFFPQNNFNSFRLRIYYFWIKSMKFLGEAPKGWGRQSAIDVRFILRYVYKCLPGWVNHVPGNQDQVLEPPETKEHWTDPFIFLQSSVVWLGPYKTSKLKR